MKHQTIDWMASQHDSNTMDNMVYSALVYETRDHTVETKQPEAFLLNLLRLPIDRNYGNIEIIIQASTIPIQA